MTALRESAHLAAAAMSRPFTAIEELDHYLDSAAEPNLVLLETHPPGHLNPAALNEALGGVLAAAPDAGRHLAGASRWARHPSWQAATPGPDAAGGLLTVTSWDSPEELAALRERLFAAPMPLQATGFRVVLAVGPGHDVVILQVHHAAFDGISALALLGAIGGAYRDRAGIGRGGAPPDGPAPAIPAGPAAADLRGTAPAARGSSALAARGGSRGRAVTWPGAVTRIAAQGGDSGQPGYGFVLTTTAVPRPDREGRGPGVPRPTVNDVLVAALILTVERWNTAHGRRSGRIRITVPVDGRKAEQRWQGYENLSRLIRVPAGVRQRSDPAALLAHVAARTRAGRQQRRPRIDAMSRLLAAGWAPTVVKGYTARWAHRLAKPILADTSLVTNLGVLPDPPSFGDTGGGPLWCAAPAPMPRGLSVGAITVAGRLCLSIRYRLALMDEAGAIAFAAEYGRALTELARPAALTSAATQETPQ